MPHTPTDEPAPLAPPVARVLGTLIDLGTATAAQAAAHVGMAYSTVTPKLRTLADLGLAEAFKAGDGTTQWRPTDTGRTRHTSEATPQPIDTDTDTSDSDSDSDSDSEDVSSDEDAVSDAALPAVGGSDTAADPGVDHPLTEPATDAPEIQPDPDAAAPDHTDDGDGDRGDPVDPRSGAGSQPEAGGPAPTAGRRPKGTLAGQIRAILHTHPNKAFTVAQISTRIDAAHADDPSTAKASRGAVANAAYKLVASGAAHLVAEKPATFQAAGH